MIYNPYESKLSTNNCYTNYINVAAGSVFAASLPVSSVSCLFPFRAAGLQQAENFRLDPQSSTFVLLPWTRFEKSAKEKGPPPRRSVGEHQTATTSRTQRKRFLSA